MIDFFKFRSRIEEDTVPFYEQKKKKNENLEKDSDDPCWDGYVQVGTKMKDGKEVPNCVPMEESKSVGYYVWKSAMDNPFAVTATVGQVKGERVKSFDNLEDAIKVADKHKDAQVTHNVSGKVLYKNGRKTRDALKYESVNLDEAKVTDDHWAIVKRNGNFYTSKSEIKKIVKPSKNPPSQSTIEKHGGDSAVRVGELKKKLKGMRDTDKLMKQLSEDTTVGVSIRDARKANDIASDLFRGEYENDGSNTFVFDDDKTADEFRAELKKQRIELDEETKPKSGDREAYQKFFKSALKRFGADSVADMDDDKKKEFFTYVDKNWESEDEKNESYINEKVNMKDLKDTIKKYNDLDHRSAFHSPKKKSVSVDGRGMSYDDAMEKMKRILDESVQIDEVTKRMEKKYGKGVDLTQDKGKYYILPRKGDRVGPFDSMRDIENHLKESV